MRLEHWLYTVPLRLRSLFRRQQVEAELDDELQYHLAMKIEEYISKGATREQARCAALRDMGGLAQRQEECRDARRVRYLEDALQDFRYALRTLRRAPTVAVVIVVSLALGIGANTAIFSVLDAVMLEMLPVRQPRQLVLLTWSAKQWPERLMSDLEGTSREDSNTGQSSSYSVSQQVYEYVRAHNRVFSDTVAFAANTEAANVGLQGRAQAASVSGVSGNFFAGLGVPALVGRTFVPGDDSAGAPAVGVVSYRFWQKHLGGDTAAMGRSITVNGAPVTLVGVAPPEFFGVEPGEAPDVWLPLSEYVAQFRRIDNFDLAAPKVWYLGVVGRLRPGATEQQARAEMKVLCDQVLDIGSAEVPRDSKVPTFDVTTMARGIDQLRYQFSTSLMLLMAMVGLVLLIACANVAGLLLAKATARRREIALRLGLGAPRSRLIRQLLTESVVLAVAGGAAGLLVAGWARQLLVTLIESGRGEIHVPGHSNLAVLLFTLAASVLSGIVFGLAPALRATRHEVMPALQQSSAKLTAGRKTFRTGKILVSAQVALCLLLLIGAGLLLRTLQRLQHVNLGFDRQNLVTFRVHPGYNGYKGAALVGYYEDLQRRVAAIPGVRSVAMTQLGPVGSGSSSTTVTIPGYTQPGKEVPAHRHKVSAGYFETLRIPILLGRAIGEQDTETSRPVAVVNQRFVRDYMRGENPLGRQLDFGRPEKPRLVTIVGVAGDVKYAKIRDDVPPTLYLAYKQELRSATFQTVMVRTDREPRGVMAAIQQAALQASKDVPVVGLKTETDVVESSLFVERIFAILSTMFGSLALVLACVGLYGTVSYTVAQRTNEIGIRMALGARRESILAMVLRESLLVVAAGVAAGLPVAWMGARLLQHQLFGLSAHDPATILLAVTAIAAVTMAAGFLPARRASRVDPMVALRYE